MALSLKASMLSFSLYVLRNGVVNRFCAVSRTNVGFNGASVESENFVLELTDFTQKFPMFTAVVN